jgi:TATA-binding protein-associated factor Taf7
MSQNNNESVLSRWSRRKLEADQLAPAVEKSVQLDTEVGLSAADQVTADTETKPVLTDADMPDIESLDEDSDFSGFMSAGVSDKLRNLALRKLFKAPVFNIRDGLDEYDEDYTYFEKLGDIVTCDMKHQIEMQEQKQRAAQEAEAAAAEPDEIEDDDIETMAATEDEDKSEQQSELVAEAGSEPETGSELETDPEPGIKKEQDDE